MALIKNNNFEELVNSILQRLFYEVETIKNNWSVRELKRAINTSLAFRAVMSTNPPIGIILCANKNDTLVKYATSGMDENLFVSKYLQNFLTNNYLCLL